MFRGGLQRWWLTRVLPIITVLAKRITCAVGAGFDCVSVRPCGCRRICGLFAHAAYRLLGVLIRALVVYTHHDGVRLMLGPGVDKTPYLAQVRA